MDNTADYDDLEIDDEEIARLAGELFTGTAVSYFPDREVEGVLEYRNGIRHGWLKNWYKGGKPEKQTLCLEGISHGISREWSESGALISEKLCEFGACVWSREFDSSGNLVSETDNAETEWLKKRVSIFSQQIPVELQIPVSEWVKQKEAGDHMDIQRTLGN